MGHYHKNSKQSNLDFRFMATFFRIRDKFHDPFEKIEKAEIKPGNIVLDYGCGPGSYTIEAAKIVGETGKIYAADIHPLAIKKVNKRAQKLNLNNIATILTDSKTGLSDDHIDVVLLLDVLHGLSDPTSVLKELHRVLKKGGLLSVDDHHLTDSELTAAISQDNMFKLKDRRDSQYLFLKN